MSCSTSNRSRCSHHRKTRSGSWSGRASCRPTRGTLPPNRPRCSALQTRIVRIRKIEIFPLDPLRLRTRAGRAEHVHDRRAEVMNREALHGPETAAEELRHHPLAIPLLGDRFFEAANLPAGGVDDLASEETF